MEQNVEMAKTFYISLVRRYTDVYGAFLSHSQAKFVFSAQAIKEVKRAARKKKEESLSPVARDSCFLSCFQK